MSLSNVWKRYLLWFAQEHVDFRHAEINSLLSLFNISMRFIEKPITNDPYWLVEFASEQDVCLLASRSVSLRTCVELWGEANCVEDLHSKLKIYSTSSTDQYFQQDKTFKIEVETFSKHITQKEKIAKLETFSYLPLKGRVRLKDPDVCFYYIEYYGSMPNKPPLEPYRVFFGRWVANGPRQLINQLSLKKRKFIGNTSMDAQLSLLMANQAQVKDGSLVLDPFVGTGSLLVAAAQFGGYVYGTDIDYLMLHGRTRPTRISQKERDHDESIRANMEQYNLQHKYLDVLINDFAQSFWKDSLRFDCIITDPPYGIREATEKIGTSKENYTISEKHLATHIPAKIEYKLTNIYSDLLKFSIRQLKLGGRLVCWFPIFREDYNEACLPSHPCLKLVANTEQVLSKYTSRRLLTYEKCMEPVTEDHLHTEYQSINFKEKYYEVREETRKERRMKKAMLREQGRIEAHRKKENNENKTC